MAEQTPAGPYHRAHQTFNFQRAFGDHPLQRQCSLMSTSFSMLAIMNAALIAEGYEEIVSENDGTVEWRLLSRNWPSIVEAELEDGAYHFTRKQAQLLSRQPGMFGFQDAYLVPAEALHVRRLWTEAEDGVRDTDILWSQDGARVFVDCPYGIWIEYVEAAESDLWSANFARGVQMKLQALLLSFREDRGAAAQMDAQADIYFQRARTNSSKGRSATEPYRRSRYARARFGRG